MKDISVIETLFFLALLFGLTGFLSCGLKAREIGLATAKQFCLQNGYQLLDDSIMQKRIRFVRSANGSLGLERTLAFEYSETGHERSLGLIVLQKGEILLIQTVDQIYQGRANTPEES